MRFEMKDIRKAIGGDMGEKPEALIVRVLRNMGHEVVEEPPLPVGPVRIEHGIFRNASGRYIGGIEWEALRDWIVQRYNSERPWERK